MLHLSMCVLTSHEENPKAGTCRKKMVILKSEAHIAIVVFHTGVQAFVIRLCFGVGVCV